MDMPTPVQITLGESGDRFAIKYPALVKTTRQPAGLNFYDIDWKAGKPGKVVIQYGKNILTIADVLHISASEDVDFASEGVAQITISAELSTAEFIAHDEARLRVHAILDGIRRSGWETTIPRSQPRLRGRDMMNYALNKDEFTTLDSAYQPNFREWMALRNSAKWAFHSHATFLEISFIRDSAHLNPAKPGVYLLNYVLKNQAEHFRSDVQSKDRARWMEALPVEISKLAPERASEEASLRVQGVVIDETYVDPPLPTK